MNPLLQFIHAELVKRKADYLSSPTYILEHYNGEQQNIEAYNGRQLLEMLQNADDASESAIDKKVLIKLDGNELIIANNGESFTEDGFRSILYISVSSKTKKRNKIGHKGLGFRSILSWADEVSIQSGETEVAFSAAYAREFLADILSESSELSDFLKQRTDVEFPIAILRVPKIINTNCPRKLDYDTIITIKLKQGVIDDVQSQIQSILGRETLIFLNNIQEIEIDSPLKKITYAKEYVGCEKKLVRINTIDHLNRRKDSKDWNIITRAGKHKMKNYELALAWNDCLDDSENVLFSYFKTDAKFPFSALVHGTFELSPDRKHLEDDTAKHNEFLTGELAELLVEAALNIASTTPIADYVPLKLLNIDFNNIDSVLDKYHFKEKLIAKIKENALFPNVNGEYFLHALRPIYYDYPVANILSGDGLSQLMPICDDPRLISFIRDNVTIYHYTTAKYISIISNKIYQLSLEQISKLIYHLLTYQSYVAELSSPEFKLTDHGNFLIDVKGELIPWDANIFLQPSDDTDIHLPSFLNLRFVHNKLVDLLSRELVVGRGELVQKLSILEIKEFSFIQITETLVQHYTRKAKLLISDIVEMHGQLFKLFKRELRQNNLEIFRLTNTPIITLGNKLKSADGVYFSKHYGYELPHSLYNYDKNKLLANAELFKLPHGNIQVIKKYFAWLGIAHMPRYVLKEYRLSKTSLYVEHILRSLKYPFSKWGWNFHSYTELYNWLPSSITTMVGEYDDIEGIFAKAKIQTIFEWIKEDDSLRQTLEKDKEILLGSTLSFYHRNTTRSFDRQEISSYTKWKISNFKFLQVESSKVKTAPNKCCLSKTITPDFSPFVERPKLAAATLAEKIQLPESTIENYLVLIGVHKEISTFPIAFLYEVLTSLPIADKTGRAARKIYREMISNFNESKIDVSHPTYKSFILSGKIFGRKGSEAGYFPVTESYYIPTKAYGSNVLKRFPLADLDSKQGVQKIEKLFGVQRLRDISFHVTGQPRLSSLNDEFKDDIERFKALIYVLRKDKDTKHEILNRLKKLKIELAEQLHAIFTHKGKSEQFDLEDYEYIHHLKKSEFLISVPTSVASISELRDCNRFCQSISEIFSIVIDSDDFSDFIHDLYGKPEVAREPRLLSYTQRDDNSDLSDAKKQLSVIDDDRLSFWRAFYYGKKLTSAIEIKDDLDLNNLLNKKLKIDPEKAALFSRDFFGQLNELSNVQLVYDLLIDHSIDFTIFTRHFFSLDFRTFFKYRIEDYKIDFRNQFQLQLYDRLHDLSIIEKVKYFVHVDEYNRITYDISYGFLTDIKRFFIKLVNDRFALRMNNIESDFSVEKKIEEALASFADQLIPVPFQLMEQKRFQALLLFAEFGEVRKQIDSFNKSNQTGALTSTIRQVKIGGNTVEYDSYQNLAQQIICQSNLTGLKIKVCKTVALANNIVKKKGGKIGGGNQSRNLRFDTAETELIGFLAELLCYLNLVEKHGTDNIKWKSENANRAFPNKFMTSEAGCGYDLELLENGKTRYIEIKGTSNINNGIYMSKKEIEVALEYPERYDLMLVESPQSPHPVIRHIRNPFKFGKGESLFNNGKVSVFNDTYILKFAWGG